LKGGARINRIVKDIFATEVTASASVSQAVPKEVWFMIRNHAGITFPMFVAHQAFEGLERRRMEILNIHTLDRWPQIKDVIRN
jgi:hypothetical protein